MAHIKRFEEFRNTKHNSNDSVNELFNSKKKKAALETAKADFEDKLKELKSKGIILTDDQIKHLAKKAEDNKFRGELKTVKSRKDGKWKAIYKDGLTTLQNIASGTGRMTALENVEMLDEDEELDEYEELDEDEEFEAIQEFFNSKKKKEAKAQSKDEIEKALVAFKAKGYVVKSEILMKKAEDNKFRGELKARQSKKDGKIIVIYQDGLTSMQKLAQTAGNHQRSRGM